MKLLFSVPDGRVLGAQAVGVEGVEKRVDVIAMAMQMGGTVRDLAEAELCYAPQFGGAKDPVNLAGMIAVNHLDGLMPLADWQTLAATGSQHGYGIARRIEQISGDQVLLNQGTIYAALVRLEQRRLIKAAWGTSENNRKARYYSLTPRGRKHLEQRAETWQRLTSVMERIFNQTAEEASR